MDMMNQTRPLSIGIIGDGFMQPAFFEAALSKRLAGRDATYRQMQLDWPPSSSAGRSIISTSSPTSTCW
jgi:D-3-phosphoglycerate dehydrogenase